MNRKELAELLDQSEDIHSRNFDMVSCDHIRSRLKKAAASLRVGREWECDMEVENLVLINDKRLSMDQDRVLGMRPREYIRVQIIELKEPKP
jgi:hypothetical protein